MQPIGYNVIAKTVSYVGYISQASPDHGPGRVLVAAKSMALFELDAVCEAILHYGQVRPACSLDHLTAALAGRFSAEEVAETVREFIRLHLFEPNPPAPPVLMPVLDVEQFPVSSLVVNVANKCNLHCTYCYEPEEAKYGPAPVQMDWPTAQASVDFLFQNRVRAGRST